MAESLFGFTWEVPVGGYWWEKVLSGDMVLRWDTSAHCHVYEPLRSETGLFLTAADLVEEHKRWSNDQEGTAEPSPFLAFFNRYGRLGEGAQDFVVGGLKGRRNAVWIDTYASVYCVLEWLHYVVTLWRLAQNKDKAGLQKWISWDEEGEIRLRNLPLMSKAKLGGPFGYRSIDLEYRGVRQGDVVGVAHVFLSDALNNALHELVSPWLYCDGATGQTVFSFRVPSLWAAILLQFAQAIGGEHHYQQCPSCSRWFELAPGVNRANKQSCSDSCRQRLYRQRKERAVQLHQEGKTASEIARELDSDVTTVKGWLKRKER